MCTGPCWAAQTFAPQGLSTELHRKGAKLGESQSKWVDAYNQIVVPRLRQWRVCNWWWKVEAVASLEWNSWLPRVHGDVDAIVGNKFEGSRPFLPKRQINLLGPYISGVACILSPSVILPQILFSNLLLWTSWLPISLLCRHHKLSLFSLPSFTLFFFFYFLWVFMSDSTNELTQDYFCPLGWSSRLWAREHLATSSANEWRKPSSAPFFLFFT